MEAKRILRDALTHGAILSPDTLYRLTLDSTGSTAEAEAVAKAAIAAALRAGETPESIG